MYLSADLPKNAPIQRKLYMTSSTGSMSATTGLTMSLPIQWRTVPLSEMYSGSGYAKTSFCATARKAPSICCLCPGIRNSALKTFPLRSAAQDFPSPTAMLCSSLFPLSPAAQAYSVCFSIRIIK